MWEVIMSILLVFFFVYIDMVFVYLLVVYGLVMLFVLNFFLEIVF